MAAAGKNVQALTRRVSSGNLDLLQRAQLCWWWPWQIHLFRAEQHIESGSIEVVLWKMWYCNVVYCFFLFFKACFLEKYEKCSFLTSYSYASFFQWMPPYLVRSESTWIDSHLWYVPPKWLSRLFQTLWHFQAELWPWNSSFFAKDPWGRVGSVRGRLQCGPANR